MCARFTDALLLDDEDDRIFQRCHKPVLAPMYFLAGTLSFNSEHRCDINGDALQLVNACSCGRMTAYLSRGLAFSWLPSACAVMISPVAPQQAIHQDRRGTPFELSNTIPPASRR
jgi:hypothetical protein